MEYLPSEVKYLLYIHNLTLKYREMSNVRHFLYSGKDTQKTCVAELQAY